jgi:tetratricopeptide (TPR) repeat protein
MNRKSVALLIVMSAAAASAARANDKALTNCNGADPSRVIAGCTELITRRLTEPERAKVYNNRGKAYTDKNDSDRAIADLNESIRLDPRFEIAYINRGNAYAIKGRQDRAIADYDEAIRLNPRNSDAYYNRGASYEARNELRNALADYRKFLEFVPNDAHANAAIARVKKKM